MPARMYKELVEMLNEPSKNLKAERDWQVTKVSTFDHAWTKNEKDISISEGLQIIRRLERHWGIYITSIFPEYEWEDYGDAWAVSRKAAAVNISAKSLRASTTIHEVSHGIVECTKEFHMNGNKLNEPAHGPIWCGVYAYNIQLILDTNVTKLLDKFNIKYVSPDSISAFRTYFKEA